MKEPLAVIADWLRSLSDQVILHGLILFVLMKWNLVLTVLVISLWKRRAKQP